MSSNPELPATMKALITKGDGTADVQEVPIPNLADDEVPIKNVALAQNPTDWKFIQNVKRAGTICGCDFSGYAAKIGKDVTSLSVGDHVAGFTQGGTYTDRGAFAEYVKASADLVWKVPDGTLSHGEAATLGCAFWTAVQGLFHPTRLGLVEPPEQVSTAEWVFVYGGSTSVGMFVIQLAHLAGYKVITVASPRNFELCKSLGAEVVFDYRDPDVITKIKDATDDSIHYGFDTISSPDSQKFSVRTFGPGPGKLVILSGPEGDVEQLREDIKIIYTLIYTSLGREFTLRARWPASTEDHKHMADFLIKVPDLIKSGGIRPNPIKRWAGGLGGINGGLEYMKKGNVSGEKIVYDL